MLTRNKEPASLPRLSQARAREGCTAYGTGPMVGSPLKRPRKFGVRNEDDSVIAFHLTKHRERLRRLNERQ